MALRAYARDDNAFPSMEHQCAVAYPQHQVGNGNIHDVMLVRDDRSFDRAPVADGQEK